MGGAGRNLPSGDVCFVFTDVEASTALLRVIGDVRWAELLRRTQALIGDAVERHGGVVVSTEGDGCFAAFGSATAAVAACSDAQAALGASDWGGVTVRVRMGLHAGDDIRPTGDDYVALAVHRAARVCAAAHGGQVLLTESVAAQCPDVGVVELGLFSVRDFAGPVRLFALPGSASHLPRVPPAFDAQVPSYPTALVDRDDEVQQVIAALDTAPVVALTGPPGIGKTRIATAVLAQLSGDDVAGRWFADLSSVQRAADVGDAIARAVGCPPSVDVDVHLETALDGRRGILVLDGCDAIADAARSAASLLTDWCPSLHVLVTARTAASDETAIAVGPLPIPGSDDLAAILDSAAGRLALERVRSPRPIAELYALCVATGGVPLAIELAVASGASPDAAHSIDSLVDHVLHTLPADARHALAALTVPVPPVPARLAHAAARAVGGDRALDLLVERGALVQLHGDAVRLLAPVRDLVRRELPAELRATVLHALLDECLTATRGATSLGTFEPVADTAAALLHEDAVPVDKRQRLAAQLAPWWQGRLGPARAREALTAALALGDTGPASAALHLAIAAVPDADVLDTERHLRDAARELGSHDAVDPALVERLKRATGGLPPGENLF